MGMYWEHPKEELGMFPLILTVLNRDLSRDLLGTSPEVERRLGACPGIGEFTASARRRVNVAETFWRAPWVFRV